MNLSSFNHLGKNSSYILEISKETYPLVVGRYRNSASKLEDETCQNNTISMSTWPLDSLAYHVIKHINLSGSSWSLGLDAFFFFPSYIFIENLLRKQNKKRRRQHQELKREIAASKVLFLFLSCQQEIFPTF